MLTPTRKPSDAAAMIVVGLVFMVIGLVLWLTSSQELALGHELRISGHTVTGAIDSVTANKGLTVHYRYEVDGVSYENSAHLHGNVSSSIGPGNPIQVTYLPKHPGSSLCSLENMDSPGSSGVSRIMGVVIFIFGSLLAGAGIAKKTREIR